jgi:hypothetical protein
VRKDEGGRLVRIRYGKEQYFQVQKLHLGMHVSLAAMKFAFVDAATGEERSKYTLVGSEQPLIR